MRVMMTGPFDRYSGYGNDAVDMAIGLSKQGVDLVPWPTKLLPGLPREFVQLLTKNPANEYDVVFAFAPPFDIHADDLVRLAPKVVGYSMWETSRLTIEDMQRHGFGDHAAHILSEFPPAPGETEEADYEGRYFSWSKHPKLDHRGLDLMIVTCPMNVEAFAAVDPHVPIKVQPCGVDVDFWRQVDRPVDRRMRFGMIGMLAGRKDPFLLLQAWQQLKLERPDFDAVLSLKTSCPGLHPKLVEVYPDVELHDRSWTSEQVRDWYSTVDVLVSVSRGEGNNKPAMEFMSTGGTVIASDWSGHQNWLYPDTGYALPGTLRPVHPSRDDVLDFRVDVEALKATLLHTWENRAEVRVKGEASARLVRSSLSWDAVCAKLVTMLERVVYG